MSSLPKWVVSDMSDLPPTATEKRTLRHASKVPGPDMRSGCASAPGPADGCFLGVRRGARDLRDDVAKLRGLGTCVLTPEKQRPAGAVQAQIYCSEGSGRASLPVHLVNKAPKEHLDVHQPSHLGNVGQHRPLVTPRQRCRLHL